MTKKGITHSDVQKAEAKVIDPTDNAMHPPEVIEALPAQDIGEGTGFYILDGHNHSFLGPYVSKDAADVRLRQFSKAPTGHGPLFVVEAAGKPDAEARPSDPQRG